MSKTVLLVGGGGREHALAWKLRQSPRLGKIFVAPGNAGTSPIAENVPLKATDIDGLLAFALEKSIDLTVVGQDDPLAMGIVDAFKAKGLRIFGPTKAAAQIEADKAFAKNLMQQWGVPTAPFEIVYDYQRALELVRDHFGRVTSPIVVKASGLALGKGAYVCRTLAETKQALDDIMVKRVHGSAGDQVVIETFVPGQEVSIHAFCDGESFQLCPVSQDHKPVLDGDQGPNTGGMGTIAPVPWFTANGLVSQKIVAPILSGLKEQGAPFVGLLYPGLKMPGPVPMVLEFNARFGDPETQVLMRLLKTDLLDIFEACVEGRLDEIEIEWHHQFAACIVLASGGYPGNYQKGLRIRGIETTRSLSEIVVFHAGTRMDNDNLVTNGGRVLGVTATGETLKDALQHAYNAVDRISFEGMQYRKDIGAKSLRM